MDNSPPIAVMLTGVALSPPPVGRGPQEVPQSPMIHRTVSGDADHLPASVSESSARALAALAIPAIASTAMKSARMRAPSSTVGGREGSMMRERPMRSLFTRARPRVDTGFLTMIGSRCYRRAEIPRNSQLPNLEMPLMSRMGSWSRVLGASALLGAGSLSAPAGAQRLPNETHLAPSGRNEGADTHLFRPAVR